MVVLPEAHPLCVKEKIEIENLENEPFMLSEHGGKNEVTELLEKSGVHPQKQFCEMKSNFVVSKVILVC